MTKNLSLSGLALAHLPTNDTSNAQWFTVINTFPKRVLLNDLSKCSLDNRAFKIDIKKTHTAPGNNINLTVDEKNVCAPGRIAFQSYLEMY